jgi:hypothetical protein
MTVTTQLVRGAPLAEPGDEKYGLQIAAVIGLPSGTVHPIPVGSMAWAGSSRGGRITIRAS